jgi:tetratricopeptide (TPR) repeat protein
MALTAAGQTREAISVLRDLVRRQPDAWSMIQISKALVEVGRNREGKDIAIQGVAIARRHASTWPGDARAKAILGAALAETGDLPGAVTALPESTRLQPDDPVSHRSLGYALGLTGDPKGDIAEYRAAIRLKADDFQSHRNLGIALCEIGDQSTSPRWRTNPGDTLHHPDFTPPPLTPSAA